jgi:hypothetical protein
MLTLDFSSIQLPLKQESAGNRVWDMTRKKWLLLTPEEYVRQLWVHYLISQLQYPQNLIATEKTINLGSLKKRFDIVIYNRDHKPWMIIECKAPDVTLSPNTLSQILSYQNTLQATYLVLTNGISTLCGAINADQQLQWLEQLPEF